ncbi:Acetyltransferase [Pseudomonas syringae pv. actinidiae]|uniref:Acetyltransferase n=1 Tax=Pseudomonas syringae pv. actinidiae TaxID=103796 RepID=A0AAN4QCM5_PSESF|nr:Acetyltransferase [Pseudomonas syringae pv. actinidiae]
MKNRLPADTAFGAASSASKALRALRHCLMPRKIRYPAPASFRTRNALADATNTAPSPAVTAVATTISPSALPSEPIIARAGPWLMEFDSAMTTAGPGVRVTTKAIIAKLSQCCSESIL